MTMSGLHTALLTNTRLLQTPQNCVTDAVRHVTHSCDPHLSAGCIVLNKQKIVWRKWAARARRVSASVHSPGLLLFSAGSQSCVIARTVPLFHCLVYATTFMKTGLVSDSQVAALAHEVECRQPLADRLPQARHEAPLWVRHPLLLQACQPVSEAGPVLQRVCVHAGYCRHLDW